MINLRRRMMAGIISGLPGLFGLGRCGGNKEKDHLLDSPDMYHVPVKPYVEQHGAKIG